MDKANDAQEAELIRLFDSLPVTVPDCERCGVHDVLVKKAPIMTAYASGVQPQPFLCPQCTEDWIEQWDERWTEYYSGCL